MTSVLIDGMPWKRGVPPVLVNELGHEWYEVEDFSDYLKTKELYSKYRGYVVRMKNGECSYVLTDSKGILFDSKNYESVLYHIDALWLSEQYPE